MAKPYVKPVFYFVFCLVSCFSPLDSASQNIDSLIKQLPSLKGKEKVAALSDLCYYTSTSNTDQSIKFGNMAVSLAKQLGDSIMIASTMNDLALSYQLKGNFDSCIYLGESAYKIRLAKKLYRDAGASLSKAATGYSEQGKYSVSIQTFFKCVELFSKVNAENEIGQMKNNIGIIYEKNRQLTDAKKMYSESAESALKAKNYSAYVVAKGNYATISRKLGDAQSSINTLNELVPICKEHCPPEFLSQLYQALGVSERALKHTEKGLEYYLKALAIYEEIGSETGVASIKSNIGNCYFTLKQYDKAEQNFLEGLQLAKKVKSLQYQERAYEGLAELYNAKEEHQKANQYMELRMRVHDSIYNKETQSRLAEYQTLFDVKEKENKILEQEKDIAVKTLEANRQKTSIIMLISAIVVLILIVAFLVMVSKMRRRRSEIIFQQKMQKERSRISKDLHDNMGAELTIISSAIDIKAYGTEKEKDKQDLETISDQVRKASALMRDTIWTVSEEKVSVEQFGLKIKEFAERTFQHKNIKVHFKNTDTQLNLRPESTLNLFRMVQEVINNAAKHSAAKNFYIENFLSNSYIILLQDDGNGFDQNTAERGYGLNNITNRAKDINAKVKTSSKPGEGTKVVIHISEDSIWK
ncbi:MAG: hypothetical protein K0S32_4090 [Bacteroidetes bacterium]|nr:hypothetical protein [Bacteroidota bacterium]